MAAGEIEIESMPPREYSPFDSQFEDSLLAAGDLAGRTVLDLSCGFGDLTLRLIDAGASVTSLDLSPASIDVTRRRIELFRPDADVAYVVASAEHTGLRDSSFDVVVGKWVLHHLDLSRAAREARRVLKPGGLGIFIKTSALNPVMRFARRRLAGLGPIGRYGTVHERPLGKEDLALLHSEFGNCSVDFPNFVLFRLIDRHILRWRLPPVGRRLRALDSAIESRGGRVRSTTYYMRIGLVRER